VFLNVGDLSSDNNSQLFNGLSTMRRPDTEMNTNRNEVSPVIDTEIKKALYGKEGGFEFRKEGECKIRGFATDNLVPVQQSTKYTHAHLHPKFEAKSPTETKPNLNEKHDSKRQSEHKIDPNFKPEFKTVESMNIQFDKTRLQKMLGQFGQFPEKYRFITWKHLLELPSDKQAFESLISHGIHSNFQNLSKRFTVESSRIYNKTVRILSALTFWNPLIGELEFLPGIVKRLFELIPHNDMLVLELSISLIVHWMQVWFEAYPSEPVPILKAVESIIYSEDH
jgi:hypothetical protein